MTGAMVAMFGARSASGGGIPLSAVPGSGPDSFTLANGTIAGNAGPSVVASGGTTPYTYAWSKTIAGPGITLTTTNAAQVIFTSAGTNQERFATIQCVVTDALGATVTIAAEINTVHGSPP